MDIEHLSKSQIILLTLLVSFVTSIATGIVTISLIDQAPPAVTQSVSRIIRETVQSAVPPVISQSAAVVVQPRRNDPPAESPPDLSHVIASAGRSLVRLYSGNSETPTFLGLGVVLDAGGTTITDASSLGSLGDVTAVTWNGSSTPMTLISENTAHGFVYLSPVSTSSSRGFIAAIRASEPAAVGESIIALSGKSTLRIASGLVVGLGSETSQKAIFTDFSADSIVKGMPIINARGEFVGISSRGARAYEATAFLPILPPISHDGGAAPSSN